VQLNNKYDTLKKFIDAIDSNVYLSKDYIMKTIMGEDWKLIERRAKINKILNKSNDIR